MVFSHFWRLASRCTAISSIALLAACGGGSSETAANSPGTPIAPTNTAPAANASVALNFCPVGKLARLFVIQATPFNTSELFVFSGRTLSLK